MSGLGGLAAGIAGSANPLPEYQQQFVGGSQEAEAARRARDDAAVAGAQQYNANLLTRGTDNNLVTGANRATQSMLGGLGVGDTLIRQAGQQNPYIGRTEQDALLAQQVVREAGNRNMAQAQAIGGAAGARAAAGANAGAQVEAARAQQLAQQQERAQMAQAYNQSLSTRGNVAFAGTQAAGQLGLGMTAQQQQFDVARGQIAGAQAGTFVGSQQATDKQSANNYAAKYAADVAKQQQQQQAMGNMIGGIGDLGMGLASGGASMLGS